MSHLPRVLGHGGGEAEMSGPLHVREGFPPGLQWWMLGREEVVIVLEVGRGRGVMEKWSEGRGRSRADRYSSKAHPICS